MCSRPSNCCLQLYLNIIFCVICVTANVVLSYEFSFHSQSSRCIRAGKYNPSRQWTAGLIEAKDFFFLLAYPSIVASLSRHMCDSSFHSCSTAARPEPAEGGRKQRKREKEREFKIENTRHSYYCWRERSLHLKAIKSFSTALALYKTSMWSSPHKSVHNSHEYTWNIPCAAFLCF